MRNVYLILIHTYASYTYVMSYTYPICIQYDIIYIYVFNMYSI